MDNFGTLGNHIIEVKIARTAQPAAADRLFCRAPVQPIGVADAKARHGHQRLEPPAGKIRSSNDRPSTSSGIWAVRLVVGFLPIKTFLRLLFYQNQAVEAEPLDRRLKSEWYIFVILIQSKGYWNKLINQQINNRVALVNKWKSHKRLNPQPPTLKKIWSSNDCDRPSSSSGSCDLSRSSDHHLSRLLRFLLIWITFSFQCSMVNWNPFGVQVEDWR